MIVKTKFYCKGGAQEAGARGNNLSDIKWVDIFIEGKWYDGEYETWSFDDGFRINGGWRKYWVINERGVQMQLSRAKMGSIFELKNDKLRDIKINELLNDGGNKE